jgi:uncharacterized damage-inducible protein DinB
MSLLASYQALARYNTWMNARLYALCAERLDDEQRKRDLGAFFRSIHGTFNHLLLADRIWLTRFTGDPERYASREASGAKIAFRSLAQELYADFDELRRQRERTDHDIEEFVGTLEADALEATLDYRASTGARFQSPLWWALSHVFNHQTHHRGQVTTLMHQLGVDPGVTDFVVFLRDASTPSTPG